MKVKEGKKDDERMEYSKGRNTIKKGRYAKVRKDGRKAGRKTRRTEDKMKRKIR